MEEIKPNKRVLFNFRSIKGKIAFSFVSIILFTIFLVWIAATQINQIIRSNREIDLSLSNTQKYTYGLRNTVNQTNVLLQNQLLDSVSDYGSMRAKLWDNEIRKYIDSLNQIKSEWSGSEIKLKYAQMVINIRKLKNAQDEVDEFIAQETIFESKDPLQNDQQEYLTLNKPKKLFKSKVLELMDDINSQFEELQSLQNTNYNEKKNKVSLLINRFLGGEILLVLGFVLFLIIMAIYILNRINDRITSIKKYVWSFTEGNIPKEIEIARDEFNAINTGLYALSKNLIAIRDYADHIGKGEFTSDISVFNNTGELGASFNEMHKGLIDIAERDKQRNWTNEGIALFSNLLREYNDVQTLYDSLISNIVKYLGANQGGIFILNDSNEKDLFFELKSVYAFDRKRFIDKEIRIGQGLVGQSWREKDVIYLDKVSDSYVQIASGLGGANPRSVLICPMINNEGKVLGAMEIASFKKFVNFEIDFVRRVSEMIVSAISSIKNNEKNRLLLEEAQEATRKLKNQELELRNNLIKLEEAQEILTLNNAELKGQTDAIDATLATIEYDLKGNIQKVNDKFLQVIHYSREELLNKDYLTIFNEKEFQIEDHQNIWQLLKMGKSISKEMKTRTRFGEEVWLNTSFTPVIDAEQKVFKVIQLALETTEQKLLSLRFENQFVAIDKSYIIIEFDLEGKIITLNDNYLNLLGYQLDELQGKHHSILASIEDIESKTYQSFWDELVTGANVQGKFKRISKEGKEIWIRGSYNPIFDINGKMYKIMNIALDITDMVHQEEKVKQKIEQFEKQKQDLTAKNQNIQKKQKEFQKEIERLELHKYELQKNNAELEGHIAAVNASIATVEFALDGTILNANPIYLHAMKYRLSEIKGLHHSLFLDKEEAASKETEKFWKEIKLGHLSTKKINRIAKDGSMVSFLATYTPVRDQKGEPYKILKLAIVLEENPLLKEEEKVQQEIQSE